VNSDNKIQIIAKNLELLGIKSEATFVYIELAKSGPSSALQLAKLSKVSRTQIYRHIESLQEHGLVSAERLSYGTSFRALPIENIEGSIADREAEMAEVKKDVGSMAELLQQMVGGGGPQAMIQHYYGLAGLKQANWNLTKAKKEYRIFEAAHLSSTLDKAFVQRCRERYIENKLTCYALTNNKSVKASEIEPHDPKRDFFRFIDPARLAINFEAYIYDDVVTLLDYSKDRQMAVEIHHPSLNAMMTQLFDAMWTQAVPLKIQ